MAGMFYSLQEAAEKLNKTEEQIKQIVEEGKLREFRDGPNLLFKVEEVEALMSETGAPVLEEAPEIPTTQTPPPSPEPEVSAQEAPEPEELEPEAQKPEPEESEAPPPEAVEPESEESEAPSPEAQKPELDEAEETALETPAEEILSSEEPAGTSEILLAPETGAPVAPSELTDADTALTGEGISVLGETDRDYQITDDTMAETAVPTGTTGTSPEIPLEEIEEDVNLDSFGSGSGLLDLSLQADDTSLGGILDEIYTAEGEGQEAAPPEVGSGSAAAVAAEADQMIAEEEPEAPQPAPEVPAALARPLIGVAPDTQSNTLGMLLFLPLLAVIYTAVVAVSGPRGVMPSILASIQGLIWYITGGAFVVALLVTGAAFMLSGGTTKAEKKVKKPKEPKKAKKPKEPKKPKKEKKPKEPKKPKKPKKKK
jgi:excisionase family DNA binding protein